jgi:hypothetical protein
MKTFLAAALLAVACVNPALAHGGGKPKHGGVVVVASDLAFELVGTTDGAVIYVEDHGKPLAPAGMSGKLTVLSGDKTSEAALAVVGDKLEAKGIQLAKGAKVVAAMTTAQKKTITVRFTVK